MTITLDITKADLIIRIGRALMSDGRTEEATLFYRMAAYARDVLEVLCVVPDGITVEITDE
jgi:hypothetical protein